MDDESSAAWGAQHALQRYATVCVNATGQHVIDVAVQGALTGYSGVAMVSLVYKPASVCHGHTGDSEATRGACVAGSSVDRFGGVVFCARTLFQLAQPVFGDAPSSVLWRETLSHRLVSLFREDDLVQQRTSDRDPDASESTPSTVTRDVVVLAHPPPPSSLLLSSTDVAPPGGSVSHLRFAYVTLIFSLAYLPGVVTLVWSLLAASAAPSESSGGDRDAIDGKYQ